MCFTQKTIHTVCAHSAVELIECRKFIENKNKTDRNACIAPLCQHTQALATVLGFCQNCEAFYRDSDVSSVSSSELLENYWHFKAVKKWHHPVEPVMIPSSALTETSMKLSSACFTFVRNEREVRKDMVMAASVQSLVHALGEPITHPSCDLCRRKHRTDVCRMAVGGQRATVSWASRLANAEDIFKTYEFSHQLSHTSNAEDVNRGDYGNESSLSSETVQAPQPVAFISPALPVQSPPLRRLNIHERREIEFQERQKLFAELAANHEKDIQRLREQAELEMRAEEEFRKAIAASSDATGVTASSSSVTSDHLPRSPSSSADIASAFPSLSGVHCPLIDNDEHGKDHALLRTLDYDEPAYKALTGGTHEIQDVLELRQAAVVKPESNATLHSCYGEIGDIEEENSGDPANCHPTEGRSDTIDDHIDLYLKYFTGDDDSVSNVRLPNIPPLSPITIAGLNAPIEKVVQRSKPRPSPVMLMKVTEFSQPNYFPESNGPGKEIGKGENIDGPSHPESLTSVPLAGPEIRQRAPPRRPRGPMYCPEHAGERDPKCHGCQAGCWVEIGLPPGERVEEVEPKLI
ncbi:uncharacterized protein CLUP02_08449 [Colletotrichum lupini]|uniref:Uncharacterized protein n=1 Tax=Colletotrichum lupini TaxID=145971 RepID=A0A9Q8WGX2_9PEZI|nr:uncharacterized protein CLUP02_08449 [Colletotrichum lupini]KAK1717694.1 hypothetical protein BDP67DRAFT_506684 [Colletotrichum lupini]UQC82959.1 hypothetical protein CLUP02_08449 [Colletotrichum lupini]